MYIRFGELVPALMRDSEEWEPSVGFEPATCCLQNSCSNQLSYIGMVPGERFELPKAQGRQIYSLMRLTTSLTRHSIKYKLKFIKNKLYYQC